MADDIVIRWMNEGWILQTNDTELRPRPDPTFPQLPLVFSRGQADSYLLVSPTGGKKWVLKKFYPARRPSASYLSAIQSLVPSVRGTESATSRCVLSSASLQSISGVNADSEKDFGAWLDSTVLMAEIQGEGWGSVADDLRAGRVALSRQERLQIARSLCTIVEGLERSHCAHRDLSSGNVFIELPALRASLIDWDSFYHESLPMPANTTAGSLGYIAPFISQTGSDWDAAASWEEGADRFGLSLLIVELLVTTAGSPVTGDGGIFDQAELCKRSGPGLNTIVPRIRSDLPSVYQLLMRALQATSFSTCPSATEWGQALEKEANDNGAFVRPPRPTTTRMGAAGVSAAQFGQGSGAANISPSKQPVTVPIPPLSSVVAVRPSRNLLLYSAIAIIGLTILGVSVRGFVNLLESRQKDNSRIAQGHESVGVPPSLDNGNDQTQLLNASYPSDCNKQYPDAGFSGGITVKNGIWDNGREESDKRAIFQVVGSKVTLADLTGDGRREASIETYCGMENQTLGYEEVYVVDPSSKPMRVLRKFSPLDWGDSSLGITWNTTGVKVEAGELKVGYRLGGSHAQPDWNAATGFRWDGRQFVRVDFEARGEDAGSHAHQTIQKVMPIDEAFRDSSFLAFRDDLLAAVKQKDSAYLYKFTSPTVAVGFGAEPNTRDEFMRMWNVNAPHSKVWDTLTEILENGGYFVDFQGRRQFTAPYTFSGWPQSVDSFAYCAVTAPVASLYSQPDTGSPVVGTLSYDLVKPDAGCNNPEWQKVSTGTGLSGFLQTKYVRSPIDYRAAFEMVGGRWMLVSLVAGD